MPSHPQLEAAQAQTLKEYLAAFPRLFVIPEEAVEAGTFTIRLAGQPFGEESFYLVEEDDGFRLSSRVEGFAFFGKQETQLDSFGNPLDLCPFRGDPTWSTRGGGELC